MTLLKALGKEGLKRFNELLNNTVVVDKPKKKNSNDNNFAGKNVERCNSINKCERPDIKSESTT